MKAITGVIIIFVCSLMLAQSAFCQGKIATSQQTLNMYISDLQNNPNDNILREKIIKHVQGMKQKPAIPKEVVKHEGAAEYAFKSAKNESDYLDSAKEYEKALIIAPWLARDYFNCGVAYEKAGSFKEAINYFNFYLIAAPDARDGDAVHKRIGGLEYADKKAAKESSPQTVAVREQKKSDDWLKKLDGRRYTIPVEGGTRVIDVRGKVLVRGAITKRGYDVDSQAEIRGRKATFPGVGPFTGNPNELYTVSEIYIISEDGDSITWSRRFNDGDVREFIYLWQR